MTAPNTGIPYVDEGTLDPAAGLNASIDWIDTLLQCRALDMTHTDPPVSPANGDCYVVNTPATGAWVGKEDFLARYVAEGTFWQFYEPGTQVRFVINDDDATLYLWDGAAWAAAGGGGGGGGAIEVGDLNDSPPSTVDPVSLLTFGPGFDVSDEGSGEARVNFSADSAPVVLQLSLSDLTTDLTTGTGKAYFRAPHALTVIGVRSSLIDASSSGLVTVDINKNGSTILSTKLSIDATERTSQTATTPAVISDAAMADDDEITFDIDAAGTDAKGLIVTILGSPV